jgi:hypothetical protein
MTKWRRRSFTRDTHTSSEAGLARTTLTLKAALHVQARRRVKNRLSPVPYFHLLS